MLNDLDNLEKIIGKMPKIELHIHLGGAIPLETLYSLIQKQGGDPDIRTIQDLERKLIYTDFEHFIDVWTWKNSFIKEQRDFEEITYEVLRNLSKQNVNYLEAFYSPGDYCRQGLTTQDITENIIKGKKRAYHEFGIRCELIVDLIRGHGPEIGIQRLDEVTPYLGQGIIGIGLGGNEKSFPADPYTRVYKEAKRRGFRLTAHAGEGVGPKSIWTALKKLNCERIGHGVRAKEDPRLLLFLKEKQIPLEICVASNVKTKVCKSVRSHPIRQYFNEGLMVTVNSDDPTMFNSSITQEYLILAQKLNFTLKEIKKLTINGIEASFMSNKDKKSMKHFFDREWQRLLEKYS
ncbi:MAG: adenosine deaminase [Promethearchaeota archaeon]